jgi:hypothetical protein
MSSLFSNDALFFEGDGNLDFLAATGDLSMAWF